MCPTLGGAQGVQPALNGNGVVEREAPSSTEDNLSPTVREVKSAIQNLSVATSRPLNPSAPSFTPFGSGLSTLNPNSTEFTPQAEAQSSILAMKQVQSYSLNPNCPEFVPNPKSPPLNVTASEFVPKVGLPTSMQNGGVGMGPDELGDPEEIKNLIPQEEEVPVLEPQDIVEGFEKVEKVSAEEQEGYDQLLKATAEMLLKATMYPGSFDRLKLNISTAIQKWPPTASTLTNLGEMIIHWVGSIMILFNRMSSLRDTTIIIPCRAYQSRRCATLHVELPRNCAQCLGTRQ